MKKNVLIFGFLQLLVCMPMALLSSEEGDAADKQKAARSEAMKKMDDYIAARRKEGFGSRHMKERVTEGEGAYRSIREYTSERKELFDCKVKSIADLELTEEEKAKKKKDLLRERLQERITEKKIRRDRKDF